MLEHDELGNAHYTSQIKYVMEDMSLELEGKATENTAIKKGQRSKPRL